MHYVKSFAVGVLLTIVLMLIFGENIGKIASMAILIGNLVISIYYQRKAPPKE